MDYAVKYCPSVIQERPLWEDRAVPMRVGVESEKNFVVRIKELRRIRTKESAICVGVWVWVSPSDVTTMWRRRCGSPDVAGAGEWVAEWKLLLEEWWHVLTIYFPHESVKYGFFYEMVPF